MKRKFMIIFYFLIYLIIGLIYSEDIISEDILPKIILYFITIILLSIIYPIVLFSNRGKRYNIKFKVLIKNYILLLFLSNITNLYIAITYDFNKWGIDYEGLAVGFIYFGISIVLTIVFYMLGIVILKICYKVF